MNATAAQPSRAHWAAFAVAALLCAATYLPSLGVGLLSDDWGLASSAAAPGPWASLHGHWFGGGHGDFYRPLPRLALSAQGAVLGDSGVGQHLVSLALHLACGLFLFLALARAGEPVGGLMAAAFALVHPANVEAVAWVSSQTDLLATAFLLAAIAVSIGEPTLHRSAASLGLAACVCLSKESAILVGPALAAGFVLAAWRLDLAPPVRRRLLLLGGCHAVLWILYMLARRLLLGRFLVGLESTTAPAIVASNVVSCLGGLLEPVVPGYYAARAQVEAAGTVLLPALLLVPGLLALALWRRRMAMALALLAFGASLGTFVGSFDKPASFSGNYRYFYLPLFPFAAIAGLAAASVLREIAPARRLLVPVALVGGLLLVRSAAGVHARLAEFTMAGQLRDDLAAEIVAALGKHPDPVVLVDSMPDRVGGAYVFRNGFPEFARATFGRELRIVSASDADPGSLPDGAPVYRLNAQTFGARPYFFHDEAMTAAVARLKSGASAPRPTAPPIRYDFTDPGIMRRPVFLNEHVELASLGPDRGIELRIRGTDPNIGFPFPRERRPGEYVRAYIELEVTPAVGDESRADSVEFLFLPAGEGAAAVTLGRPLVPGPGFHRYEFDLSANLVWQSASALAWMRFDPVSREGGRIAIRSAGLE
jgi:hypothetical protein